MESNALTAIHLVLSAEDNLNTNAMPAVMEPISKMEKIVKQLAMMASGPPIPELANPVSKIVKLATVVTLTNVSLVNLTITSSKISVLKNVLMAITKIQIYVKDVIKVARKNNNKKKINSNYFPIFLSYFFFFFFSILIFIFLYFFKYIALVMEKLICIVFLAFSLFISKIDNAFLNAL
jgi:hypothetical protein